MHISNTHWLVCAAFCVCPNYLWSNPEIKTPAHLST